MKKTLVLLTNTEKKVKEFLESKEIKNLIDEIVEKIYEVGKFWFGTDGSYCTPKYWKENDPITYKEILELDLQDYEWVSAFESNRDYFQGHWENYPEETIKNFVEHIFNSFDCSSHDKAKEISIKFLNKAKLNPVFEADYLEVLGI